MMQSLQLQSGQLYGSPADSLITDKQHPAIQMVSVGFLDTDNYNLSNKERGLKFVEEVFMALLRLSFSLLICHRTKYEGRFQKMSDFPYAK